MTISIKIPLSSIIPLGSVDGEPHCCIVSEYLFAYLNILSMACSDEGIDLSSYIFLRLCSHKQGCLKKEAHIFKICQKLFIYILNRIINAQKTNNLLCKNTLNSVTTSSLQDPFYLNLSESDSYHTPPTHAQQP